MSVCVDHESGPMAMSPGNWISFTSCTRLLARSTQDAKLQRPLLMGTGRPNSQPANKAGSGRRIEFHRLQGKAAEQEQGLQSPDRVSGLQKLVDAASLGECLPSASAPVTVFCQPM